MAEDSETLTVTRLDQMECSIEDRHPCDISVAASVIRDVALEAGVDAPTLQRILTEGFRSEDEVRTAFRETVEKLTGPHRDEAIIATNFAYRDLFASEAAAIEANAPAAGAEVAPGSPQE